MTQPACIPMKRLMFGSISLVSSGAASDSAARHGRRRGATASPTRRISTASPIRRIPTARRIRRVSTASPIRRVLSAALPFLLALISAGYAPHGSAQSLTGVGGLVTIPTAEVQADGTLTAGFNLLNRASMAYHGGLDHARAPYVSLVFLPFVEVGIRLTRAESPVEEALGDRMVNARARFLKETRWRPALLVGIHDFIGAKRHFQATYAVATKTWSDLPGVARISLHAGYGTKLLDAELYEFVGFFGGAAVSPVPGVRLLGEYTDRRVNVGFDAVLFRGLRFLVGMTDLRAVSGGVSYSTTLPR